MLHERHGELLSTARRRKSARHTRRSRSSSMLLVHSKKASKAIRCVLWSIQVCVGDRFALGIDSIYDVIGKHKR
jgi:hypothetical protein